MGVQYIECWRVAQAVVAFNFTKRLGKQTTRSVILNTQHMG